MTYHGNCDLYEEIKTMSIHEKIKYIIRLSEQLPDLEDTYKDEISLSHLMGKLTETIACVGTLLNIDIKSEIGRYHTNKFAEAKLTFERLMAYIKNNNITMKGNDMETLIHIRQIIGNEPKSGQREAIQEAHRDFVSINYLDTQIPYLWSDWLISSCSLVL